MGVSVPAWVRPMDDEILATIRSRLDDATFDAETNAGRALSPDEAVATALEALEALEAV
jgi:hypothetical protein